MYHSRAATVFRIGYFPWVSPGSTSAKKKQALALENHAYQLGIQYYTPFIAFRAVEIPYPNAPKGAYNKTIQGYLHANRNWAQAVPLQNGSSSTHGSSVNASAASSSPPEKQKFVLLIGGLDHYRAGQWENVQTLLQNNFTTLVLDMPGTGSSPISGRNSSADATLWKTVLDWVEDNANLFAIDTHNMHIWGTSTGSYYAIKASRSEHQRIKSVLGQGQASHFAFMPDWITSADSLAYPTDLSGPLASAFGYSYDTKDQFVHAASNYSLLHLGVLDAPAPSTTVINGLDDTVFPVDDAIIFANHGPGALTRLFPNSGHMGGQDAAQWVGPFWADVQHKEYT